MQEMEAAGKIFSFRAPTINNPAFRYFDDQGKEIISKNTNGLLDPQQKFSAVYWVNVRITPRAVLPRSDGKTTELAHLTVEVACNPTQTDLSLPDFVEKSDESPRFNLLKPPAGVRVLTYSAYVGRNE